MTLGLSLLEDPLASGLILGATALVFGFSIYFFVLASRRKQTISQELRKKEEAIHALEKDLYEKNVAIAGLSEELGRVKKQSHHSSDLQAALGHLIGHDLKNAMNAILGFGRKGDEARMLTIQHCGNLALSMITNMMDVPRFEDGQVHLRLRHNCLLEVASEAKAQVQFLMDMKSLNLKINIPVGKMVLIDKQHVVRLLVNLLVNAVKYSGVGQTITINVEERAMTKGDTEFTKVVVKDEGTGIAPEKQQHIFEKYWHYHDADMGKAASAGLGLAYCKLATEAHGGKIEIDSEPGRGTSFIMFFPTSQADIGSCESEDPLSSLRDVLEISEEDRILIKDYSQRLNDLRVYEITKIREVIQELSERNVDNNWTGELQLAVYQGNQEKFDELLEMVR